MVIHVCALLCFVGQSQKNDLTETEVIIIGVICAVILLSLIIVLIVIICRRRTNGRRPIHVDPCSSFGIDYSLPEYICLKIYSRIKKITQVLQSTNIVDWFCLFCNEK